MARRRRRRRGFGDLVSLPSLGGIAKDYNPWGKTVRSQDVIIGAGIGMAGGMVVKIGLGKLDEAIGGKLPDFIKRYAGPISTFLAGAAAYYFQRGKNRSRGTGHLVGATLAAIVPLGWDMLRQQFPQFADLVDVNLGLPIDEGVAGMLVDDPSMAALAAYSMSDEEDVLDAA